MEPFRWTLCFLFCFGDHLPVVHLGLCAFVPVFVIACPALISFTPVFFPLPALCILNLLKCYSYTVYAPATPPDLPVSLGHSLLILQYHRTQQAFEYLCSWLQKSLRTAVQRKLIFGKQSTGVFS